MESDYEIIQGHVHQTREVILFLSFLLLFFDMDASVGRERIIRKRDIFMTL